MIIATARTALQTEGAGFEPFGVSTGEDACLAAKLRPDNVHSPEGGERLLLPGVEWQQKLDKEVVFRAGVAFPKSEIYEPLEELLRPPRKKLLAELAKWARKEKFTLVFAARDLERSNAAVVAEMIRNALQAAPTKS